jgi:hypothetical protein
MRKDKQRKVKRLRKRKQPLPRTVQNEPISRQTEADDRTQLEERAQARETLNDPNAHPVLVVTFYEPRRDEKGNILPPHRCDSRVAKIGDREIHREPNETYEVFRHRVASYLPVNAPSPFVLMVPTDEA